MKLLWFSAGATSAVACKIAINRYGLDNVKIFYFEINTSHSDNKRFIKDCEKWYGKEIEHISSTRYKNQFEVIEKTKYVNGASGARCTGELKRSLREKIQADLEYSNQIFGFEFTKKEIKRAKRLPKDTKAIFPLIEERLDKKNCLAILKNAGIEIPKMYKLGYPNNNCIGCVKGGMGYWNKIRVDFPETFNKMALLERKIGRSCIKDRKGRIFLDELKPDMGKDLEIIVPECGFFCGDTETYI